MNDTRVRGCHLHDLGGNYLKPRTRSPMIECCTPTSPDHSSQSSISLMENTSHGNRIHSFITSNRDAEMDLSPAKYPRVCRDLLPDHLTLPARPAPPASSLLTGGPVSLLTGGPSSLVAPAPANTLPFRSNGSGFISSRRIPAPPLRSSSFSTSQFNTTEFNQGLCAASYLNSHLQDPGTSRLVCRMDHCRDKQGSKWSLQPPANLQMARNNLQAVRTRSVDTMSRPISKALDTATNTARPRSVDPSWNQHQRRHSPHSHNLTPTGMSSLAPVSSGLYQHNRPSPLDSGFRRPSPLDSGFDSAKTYSPDLSHYSDQSYGGMISPVIVSSQMMPTTSTNARSSSSCSQVATTPPATSHSAKNKGSLKDRPSLSAPKDRKPCERLYRSCDRISKTSDRKSSSLQKALHTNHLVKSIRPPVEEEKRPHSVDLGGLDRWLYVIPGHRTRPKECDERCDEFVRAGIGNCLKGIQWIEIGFLLEQMESTIYS